MKNRFRHIYSFPNGLIVYHGYQNMNIKFPHGRDCINDGTPLEDLGDYLLSKTFLKPEDAFKKFINLI